MPVKFDYSKSRGRIKELYKTETEFAKELGLSTVSLSGRLINKLNFEQSEMLKIGDLLNIDKEDLHIYFFTRQVKKI